MSDDPPETGPGRRVKLTPRRGLVVHPTERPELDRVVGSFSPPRPPRPRARRPCLRCRKMFKSEGPHHRLCDQCNRHAQESEP
jgi:hypothetical protein